MKKKWRIEFEAYDEIAQQAFDIACEGWLKGQKATLTEVIEIKTKDGTLHTEPSTPFPLPNP